MCVTLKIDYFQIMISLKKPWRVPATETMLLRIIHFSLFFHNLFNKSLKILVFKSKDEIY